MDTNTTLCELLDEIRIVAQNGLRYADDPYDEQRYQRLLDLAAEHYGEEFALPSETVRNRFADEVGHVTPKVGGDAAVFDDDGRLLVMKRADLGEWCLPCGWVEPGERPEETAVRETREETGVRVEPTELVGAYTRQPSPETGPHAVVHLVYLCRAVGGSPRPTREATAVEYRHVEEVSNWHRDHRDCALDARERWSEHDD